jgi:hypothetical protein
MNITTADTTNSRHYGKLTNPGTQEARLYSILSRSPGAWFSVWSLCTLIPSAAVHTAVSGLRPQLPPGESVENTTPWENGRRCSYYRLVRA